MSMAAPDGAPQWLEGLGRLIVFGVLALYGGDIYSIVLPRTALW
jgi:hypothetical protein